MQLNFRPAFFFKQNGPAQFGMKRRLYAPIGSGHQDNFTKASFYKPITPSLPVASVISTESSSATSQPVASTKVSKAEFLEIDLKQAEAKNLALTESFKRKISIQEFLDVFLRSGTTIGALVGTHGWGAPLIPLINAISAKVSDWTANKIKDTTVGQFIHKAVVSFKQGFNKFLSVFDSKKTKPVQFGGLHSQTQGPNPAEQQLLKQLLQATERFAKQLNNPQRTETKEQMASQLFRSYFGALQQFVNTQGSSQVKEKMTKLAQLSTDIQAVSAAIPTNAQFFNDIPAPIRRQLFSVVYDALTLDLPEITQWGESVALELGISQQRINQIKQG